jgi:hypothetical protein
VGLIVASLRFLPRLRRRLPGMMCVSAWKKGSGAKLMHVEPADGPHPVEFTSGLGTMDLSIARSAVGRPKLQELRVRSIAYCPSAATVCINFESEPNLDAG